MHTLGIGRAFGFWADRPVFSGVSEDVRSFDFVWAWFRVLANGRRTWAERGRLCSTVLQHPNMVVVGKHFTF